jgi:hypothetical protein
MWSSWYLDDGILVGSPDKIQAALSYLETQSAQLGLALNRRKCVLWGPGASHVPDKQTLTVRDWDKGEGITVLGLPVDPPGSHSALRDAWTQSAAALDKVLDLVTRLPDAQLGHHLLRACADGCRINHLLRGSDSY